MVYRPVILFCLLFSPVLVAETTTEYDWLTLGKKSGDLIVTDHGLGHRTVTFAFSDRGRGPSTTETLRLDDGQLMREYQATGNSYMGAPVNESFRVEEGMALWSSSEESGSAPWSRAAYVAANGSPETLAALVRSILAQPDQRIDLLPSGTASVRQLTEATVTRGDQSQRVRLMALSGLGFTPTYVWLDQKDQLFAVAYHWMGLTPVGWNDSLDALQKLQDQAEADYHRQLALELSQPLEGSTLIINARLLDVATGTLGEPTAVRVADGLIKATGEQAGGEANRVIDARGRTLMPGLWDMHTHISLSDGLLQIAAGVTSVRDLANAHEDLLATIGQFDAGSVIGPRVHKAGFIDQKSEFSAPTGMIADTLEQALEFVDWYAERGYPQIKIYSSITPDWVKPIAERIDEHGMRLSGHIPTSMTAEQAVRDGFDEIQHINMLFLNFLAGPEDDTRTPVRFTLVGEKAGTLDLNKKAVAEFIALLRKNQVVVDPTVTIFHSMFLNRAGEIDPSYAAIADHLPASVRRSLLAADLDINADNEAAYARSAQALLELIGMLHEGDVQLVAGTDAIAGFTLHRELELYAEAGIPNAEVLKIATLDAARVAGQDRSNGSITTGKIADLILIDGNPLQDISAIRKVVWTLKGDRLFDATRLYDAVGIKGFVAE